MPAKSANTGRTWRLVAGGSIVVVAGLAAAWFWWPHPGNPIFSDDPRVTYTGPFRNVRAEVKYVGDAACAPCHADLCESYSRHPMAKSMTTVADASPLERYDPKSHDPFQAFGYWYSVTKDGNRITHHEWAGTKDKAVVQIAEPVAYTVGSGARVRSYLVNRDGYLFESPASWFNTAGRWDLSPSYELRNWHLTRAISPGCLFCHCNIAEPVEGTLNRYRPPIFNGLGIGCERCHGPGELHVAARGRGEPVNGPDDTIVNPVRLEHSLRQAVCEQCHLQGEVRVNGKGRSDWDFRPGLPLYPFLMDFVDARNARGGEKFVSSVEEMMASRCYRESKEPNKLGCTSCHDPHRQPVGEQSIADHYRSRCLTCHAEHGCSLPLPQRQARGDSCIACHMPRNGTEVSHASITNHTVPRLPPPKKPAVRATTPGPEDLVAFHRALIPGDDPAAARNLGIARMWMLGRGMPPDVERRYAESALPLLDAAVARDHSDYLVATIRAEALARVGRPEAAWEAMSATVAAKPDDERTRLSAGALAMETKHLPEARDHFESAIRINPYQATYHHELARTYFRLGQWAKAEAACRDALRLDPMRTDTRSLLVQSLIWNGWWDKAEAELKVLRELTPADQREQLDKWYKDAARRAARPGGP
jgi:hypothetical protein